MEQEGFDANGGFLGFEQDENDQSAFLKLLKRKASWAIRNGREQTRRNNPLRPETPKKSSAEDRSERRADRK